MRKAIREFIKICSEDLPIKEPIYEFGSYRIEGQEEIADLRPFFKDKVYVGADMRKGPGVDTILNLHDINLPDMSVGTVICADTIEHVEYPIKALKEIYRILKPNGILIITAPLNMRIHNYPYDYWRFTPCGLESLLYSFKSKFIDCSDEEYPVSVVGIGVKGEYSFDNFKNDSWKNVKEQSLFIDFLEWIHILIPLMKLKRGIGL